MNKNIYIKLQEMRVEFHKKDLKKSGENKFAGFKYFELADFLPATVELLEKYKMTTIMTSNKEGAKLVLINSENPSEMIEFEVPYGDCNLKGCHDIQNQGAIISYQKRYLYMNLMDVVENDLVDRVSGEDNKTNTQKNKGTVSIAQVNRLKAIAGKKGYKESVILKAVKRDYNLDRLEDLNKIQYDEICNKFENI